MDSRPSCSRTYGKENVLARHVAGQNTQALGFANVSPTFSNSRVPPSVPNVHKPRGPKAGVIANTQVLRDANVPGPSSEQRMIFPVTDLGNVQIPNEPLFTQHAELRHLAKKNDLLLQPPSNQGVNYKTTDVRRVQIPNSRRVKQTKFLVKHHVFGRGGKMRTPYYTVSDVHESRNRNAAKDAEQEIRRNIHMMRGRKDLWPSGNYRTPYKIGGVKDDPESLRTNIMANDIHVPCIHEAMRQFFDINRNRKPTARIIKDGLEDVQHPYTSQEVFREVVQDNKAQIPSTTRTAENAQNAFKEKSHMDVDGSVLRPHSTQEASQSVAEAQKPQIPSTSGTAENAQNAFREKSHMEVDGSVFPPHSTQEASQSVAAAQKPQIPSTSGTAENAQNAFRKTSHMDVDGSVLRPHSTQEASQSVAEVQKPQIPSTSGTAEIAQNAFRETSHMVIDENVSRPHSPQEASQSVAEAQKPPLSSTSGTAENAQNAFGETSHMVRDESVSRPHSTQEPSQSVAEAQKPPLPSTTGTTENAQNAFREKSHMDVDGSVSRPHYPQKVLRNHAKAQKSRISRTRGTSKNAQRQPDYEIIGIRTDADGTPYIKIIKKKIVLGCAHDTKNEVHSATTLEKAVRRNEEYAIPLRSIKVGRRLLFNPEELRKKIELCNRIIIEGISKKAFIQQIEEAEAHQSSDSSDGDSDNSVIYETFPRVEVEGETIIYRNSDAESTHNTKVIIGNPAGDQITVNRNPLAINNEYRDVGDRLSVSTSAHENSDASFITTSGNSNINPDRKLTINWNIDSNDAPMDTNDPVGDTHASFMICDNMDKNLDVDGNSVLYVALTETNDPVVDTHTSFIMDINPDDRQLTVSDNPDPNVVPTDANDPVGDTHALFMDVDPDDQQLTISDDTDVLMDANLDINQDDDVLGEYYLVPCDGSTDTDNYYYVIASGALSETGDIAVDTNDLVIDLDLDDQLTLNDNLVSHDALTGTNDPVVDTYALSMDIDPDDQFTLNDNIVSYDARTTGTNEPVVDPHASFVTSGDMDIDPDDKLTTNDNQYNWYF